MYVLLFLLVIVLLFSILIIAVNLKSTPHLATKIFIISKIQQLLFYLIVINRNPFLGFDYLNAAVIYFYGLVTNLVGVCIIDVFVISPFSIMAI